MCRVPGIGFLDADPVAQLRSSGLHFMIQPGRRASEGRNKNGGNPSPPQNSNKKAHDSMLEASGKRSLHFDKALLSRSSTSGSSQFFDMASSLTSR